MKETLSTIPAGKLRETLKTAFGYDAFRPHQEEVIRHVLGGGRALVIMPTGGGKSICYQVPALVSDGLTLVISPLISLMTDQVMALRANGIQAAALNSSMDRTSLNQVRRDLDENRLKLLYVSPERALTDRFMTYMRSKPVDHIAIDEAHCVSIWGHDFRPEYAGLRKLISQFEGIPVLALTATADKATRQDITKQLNIPDAKMFLASFERKNITIQVRNGQQRFEQILDFLQERQEQAGIIYCLSRKSTEMVAGKLQNMGYQAAHFHAQVDSAEKRRIQEAFQNDRIRIVCATIAFGMGIDKSNIRWIIHYNMPKNIENYYQEIGRSGRDGAPADALMFYSFRDVSVYRDFIAGSESDERFKNVQSQKLDRIWDLSQATSCRTNLVLNYFGEYRRQACGHCDNCLNPPVGFDGTILAQKALSACKRVNESAGLQMLVDILRGSGRREIRDQGYHKIKTFGSGRDLSRRLWIEYLTQMVNQGLFEIDYTQRSVLKCTPLGDLVLFDGQKVTLHEPARIEKTAYQRKSKTARFEEELTSQLKIVRNRLAQALGVPAYIIFSDLTLEAIAAAKPVTPDAFLEIHGVGDFKAREYGPQMMEAIRKYILNQNHLKTVRGKSQLETLALYHEGHEPLEIARRKGCTLSTVYRHMAKLYEGGEDIKINQFLEDDQLEAIRDAWERSGRSTRPQEVRKLMPHALDFGVIMLGIAILSRGEESPP